MEQKLRITEAPESFTPKDLRELASQDFIKENPDAVRAIREQRMKELGA